MEGGKSAVLRFASYSLPSRMTHNAVHSNILFAVADISLIEQPYTLHRSMRLRGLRVRIPLDEHMPHKAKILTVTVLLASLLFSLARADSLLVDMIFLVVGLRVTVLLVRLKTMDQRCT